MFENLIESGRKTDLKGAVKNNTASVILHAILITLAVFATLHAGEAVREHVTERTVVVQQQEQKKPDEPPPPEQVATVNPPPKGFQTLSIPTTIPVDIPPPQQTSFNAADFSGVGVEGGIARGVEGGTGPVITDQPYMEAVVEERPEAISGTCISPRYPEILRQAGIEGRVMFEFVIDTLGRAERNSVRVVRTDHDLFVAPAREAVFSCRFRPGRIQGRAVRVRVQQPVSFTISH